MRSFLRIVLLLLLLPGALGAAITPAAYRESLAGIDGRLRSGDLAGAQAAARRLAAERIVYGKETLEPDLSLLQPLAEARDAKAARALAPRLARLIAALDRRLGGAAGKSAAPDARLLADLRAREALSAIPKDKILPTAGSGLLDVLSELFAPVKRWLDDVWEHVKKWLENLFPEQPQRKSFLDRLLDLPLAVTVLVVALAAAGIWLAVRALRNRRRARVDAGRPDAAPPPAADDDPLSREAGEWERYARELAESGRRREAVRAWYHAVLVALFRGGALHYRKGRTNWEYVSSLAPGYAWRGGFAELTRCFEREWYGRDTSAPEALEEAAELAHGVLGALREAA